MSCNMKKKKTDGKIITDAFEFKDMGFAVASSNTGYTKQRFHKNKDHAATTMPICWAHQQVQKENRKLGHSRVMCRDTLS